MKCWLCVLLFVAHTASASSETVSVNVARESGNQYIFTMQFLARAPSNQVFAIITDFENLSQLNPLIKSSRILPSQQPYIKRVEIVTRGCMLFFCKTIVRVEDVQFDHTLTINTEFVQSMSDFKSGSTTWTFDPVGDYTRVTYHAKMVPDFWLPPFVGPYALKKQLHSQLNYTANKINYLLTSHE